MNYNGKILLQQRALDKKKNPGKWAKTGGHVAIGETCEESIKREVYEEIGLKINDDKNYTFCNWDEEGFDKQMKLLKEYRNKIYSKVGD